MRLIRSSKFAVTRAIHKMVAGLAVAALGVGLFAAAPAHAAEIADGDYLYVDNGNGTATLTRYTGSAVVVSIPSRIGGLTVTEIGDYAFQGSRWGYELKSVNIPNTVTTIGDYAFEANAITSLNMPDSVETIGILSFAVNNISTLKLSRSLLELPYGAFSNNNELKSVTIPSSVERVMKMVFLPAGELTSVYFLGDAPGAVIPPGSSDSTFAWDKVTLHYNPATSGWSNPWRGYPAVGDVTGGGPEADTDGDGLLDRWERDGIDTDGNGSVDLDLAEMGADPNHKDMFLEVDYMYRTYTECIWFVCWGANTNFSPNQAALSDVSQAFANAPIPNPDGTTGIRMHIDSGPGSVMNPLTANQWGVRSDSNAVGWSQTLGSLTDCEYDWSAYEGVMNANFDSARRNVFHYVLYADTYPMCRDDGTVTFNSSGVSRGVPASHFLVTQGGSSWNGDFTRTQERGTFMHELGHGLGLYHGGDTSELPLRPGYLSIMSYCYQMYGVPLSGTDCTHTTGNFQPNTKLDYSRGAPFNDWDSLIFEGGAIGAPGVSATLPSTTPVDEPTIDELMTDGGYSVPGDGLVSFVGPTVLIQGSGTANLVFDVTNVGAVSESFTVDVASSHALVGGTATATVAPGETERVGIPVETSTIQPGDLTVDASLSSTLAGTHLSDVASIIKIPDMSDPVVEQDAITAAEQLAALPVGEGPDSDVVAAVIAAVEASTGSGPATIAITSGDEQSQTIGKPFAIPLKVTVKDGNGAPLAGQDVVFSIDSGSASFSGASSTTVGTGSDGTAAVELTAGMTAGTVAITAKVANYEEIPPVTFTATIAKWTQDGFFQPVDMNNVWNVVKGGATVPLKFEVFDGSTELTNTNVIETFIVKGVTCPGASVPTDDIELTTSGATSLRYDTIGGYFIQNWQTPRKAGACYEVTARTLDGSGLSALFRLK